MAPERCDRCGHAFEEHDLADSGACVADVCRCPIWTLVRQCERCHESADVDELRRFGVGMGSGESGPGTVICRSCFESYATYLCPGEMRAWESGSAWPPK